MSEPAAFGQHGWGHPALVRPLFGWFGSRPPACLACACSERRDHHLRAIVLAVRGTHSFKDLFTSLTGALDGVLPLPQLPLPQHPPCRRGRPSFATGGPCLPRLLRLHSLAAHMDRS